MRDAAAAGAVEKFLQRGTAAREENATESREKRGAERSIK